MPAWLTPVLAAYAALSAAAFLAYALDKRRATSGGPRVRERTLHLLALLGGFAGAWLGRRVLRHKTRSATFGAVIVLAAATHLALWAWIVLA